MSDVVALVVEYRDTVLVCGVAVLGVVIAIAVFCWYRSLIKPATADRALPASGRPTGHRGNTCL